MNMHYFLFMLESDLLGLLKPEQDEEEEFVLSAEISDYDLQIALDCEDLKVDIAKCINLMLAMKGGGSPWGFWRQLAIIH